jgi:hypothetical protein
MVKCCLPRHCELDRRNRNYDADLRACAASSSDAAPLTWHFPKWAVKTEVGGNRCRHDGLFASII